MVGVGIAPQAGVVGGVGEEPGDELDRDADEQDEAENRGQPGPTRRALPARERPPVGGTTSRCPGHTPVLSI